MLSAASPDGGLEAMEFAVTSGSMFESGIGMSRRHALVPHRGPVSAHQRIAQTDSVAADAT
jgi:hypothetical protein